MNSTLRIGCPALLLCGSMLTLKAEVPFLISETPIVKPIARSIKGRVVDARTGEQMVGASVFLKDFPQIHTTTGLDGTFTLNTEGHAGKLCCTYLGYKAGEFDLDPNTAGEELSLPMEEQNQELGEAVVMAHNPGRTEAGARGIERKAMNVVNVMSAKAIELSPDLTVANALGRVSGVTLERGDGGEGQYAILRGMDKRYNYTLVNGVKIPSPDNKNRFVPLDIFPAEMLDRLEVSKSLTADLEGDGIGGAVNMVMKDAPDRRQLTANAALGYNARYWQHAFSTFATSDIQTQSPNERHGTDYAVSMSDFTLENLTVKRRKVVPDCTLGLSYGDRFFHQRLGVMLAFSGQNIHRGKDADIYWLTGSSNNDGTLTRRTTSEQQSRLGAHVKLDYSLAEHHRLAWYNAWLYFRNQQVRDTEKSQSEAVRLKLNSQQIFNSTLMGEHGFGDERPFELNWRAVYAKAESRTPDNAEVYLTTASTGLQTVSVNPAALRKWEHNDDEDLAGYVDLKQEFEAGRMGTLQLQAGGMFRDKQRTSFYNDYTFKASTAQRTLVRGKDWQNFDEILFDAPRFGNLSDPLNYEASEQVGAAYLMGKLSTGRTELTAGLRAEHTKQGYHLLYPTEGARNRGEQRYWDWLPTVHLKHRLTTRSNLRLSYARAINRPGFFEIVPYKLLGEDYNERGNPDLKHTVADNVDLRYELFPSAAEQLMAGVFYKRIQNPIEYGMETSGQDTYYTPENFGTAHNMGVELDLTKYFHRLGIKANYTYTYSKIRTNKTVEEANPDPNAETTIVTRTVKQTRPLFGQAAHVANLSLLYKDTHRGLDVQLALNYTGKRLCVVSRFLDNDSWQAGRTQLDASAEQKLGTSGWSLFVKANNLLNLPLVQYVEKNARNEILGPEYERYKGGLLERKEWHGQSFLIGVRYKL